MKNKNKEVKTYNVNLNGKSYLINLKRDRKPSEFIKYDCMVWEHGVAFEEQLIPFKQFDIVYSPSDCIYWAWTGDCTTNNESALNQAKNILLSHNVNLSNLSKWTDEQIIDYASCIGMHDSMGNIIPTHKPTNTYTAYNRSFSTYQEAETYCINSDFDPSYIQSTAASQPLTMDLQLFASSQQRKVYESNYDTAKIATTQGEYIARIHPSEEHENKHKICFSSDDYFYINDTDIISISPIYKKTIITEHGIHKWGIGKGLDITYTIETTKTDPNLDDINYSNIHKYKCNSIQQTLELFNRMQQRGYHNISIQTNVNYKNDTILSDASECKLELDINAQHMDDMKKENKQHKNYIEQLEKELSSYKEFMKLYKAEKTFEQFQENMNKSKVS